jgi:outer membrane protein assembly factor BamB
MLLLIGAALRLGSYVMPWMVVANTDSFNILRLGVSPISLVFTAGAVALAIGYAAGAEWARPRLLVALGAGSILGGLADLNSIGRFLEQARAYRTSHNLVSIRIGMGVGPLAELLGGILLVAGGLWALRLAQRTLPEDPTPSLLGASTGPTPAPASGGTWLIAASVAVLLLVLILVPIPIGPQKASLPGVVAQGPAPAPPVVSDPQTPTPEPTHTPKGPFPPPPPPATSAGPSGVAFQADVAHDGNASHANVHLPLTAAWTRSFPKEVGYPLIAGGRVFVPVTSRHGTFSKSVYALDAATGRTLWLHNEVGGYSFLGLAYDRGALFVLTSDGVLRRYDPATGRQRWRTRMPSRKQSEAPPTAWGGRVYLTNGTALFSVNERNGAIVWRTNAHGGAHSSPTLTGRVAFLDMSCMNGTSFAVRDGSTRWQNEGGCAESFGSTAAYHGKLFYVRENRTCLELRPQFDDTGAGFPCWTIPAFDGSIVYTIEQGFLIAHGEEHGDVRWRFVGDRKIVSAPLVVGHTVFVASSAGHLFAVGPDGRRRGVYSLGAAATPPNEHSHVTLTGLNAGDGILAVPAGHLLVVYR